MSFKKILVAIDDSSLCPHVFAAALELAQANQAAIRLLHCIHPEIVGESTMAMTYEMNLQPSLTINDYQTQQILLERRIEKAQELLESYRQNSINRGVATETDYQVGDPGYLLCEAAKNWRADLIVVGRQGRTGLAEAFMGSVSNHVVHHAPCSVLVIQSVETDLSEPGASDRSSANINPLSS